MELSKTLRGQLTERKVADKFLSKGFDVCAPIRNDSRYDLLVDFGSGFRKLQIKTASISSSYTGKNSLYFSASTNGKNYKGHVDAMIGYWPDFDRFFLVPMDVLGDKNSVTLLLETSLHSKKKSLLAKDFEI